MKHSFLTYLIFGLSIQQSISTPLSENECGLYLCPSSPDYATNYLKNGCNDDDLSVIQPSASFNQEILMESQKEYNTKLNKILLLGGISSMSSMMIGYLFGRFDQTFYTKD